MTDSRTPDTATPLPDASTARTAPRRDPGEVVGIYLADSLNNIATARRVLTDHGLTDPAMDVLLDTARIALEAARKNTELLTTKPEHSGGNAEDCPVCRPLIDQPGGVLYPWHCTEGEPAADEGDTDA